MKVLILSETSQPSRYWEGALPLLRERGVEASFGTIQDRGPLHSRLEAQQIKTFAFGSRRATDYPFVVYKLANVLKQNAFDIVHASEAIQTTIAGLACIFARNTKCIFHYHHTHATGKQKLLSRLGSRLSDRVMAVSKASQNATVEFDGTSIEKTFVAHNGVEPFREVSQQETTALRTKLGIFENAKVVSIVGRLRPLKGHEILLDACQRVATSFTDPLHLIVVGDGSERQRLEAESSRFENFKTHFVGNQNDVAVWFSVADVIAMPSYFESFGLVAVEAMVCGKALVASDIEGPAEIVENGKSGILVPPGDPHELANAILKVLDDPEYAMELGRNARLRALKDFSIEQMVDGWIACYNHVLTDHSRV
jgi:glycosyltransferase involved in cell wall biosynthesis